MNDEILARIDVAWQGFLPSFDGLTEEAASQPGVAGYYSVKDVLAHLAWWEEQTRQVVESGHDEPIDVEATNDRIYAESRNTSFADARRRLIEAHERAMVTFASTPRLSEDDVKDDTWEHWDEHGEQIRTWRAVHGY